jgi:hypothetical protein
MTLPAQLTRSIDGIPASLFALRLLWLAVQLILIICLGQKGVLFFYQAF